MTSKQENQEKIAETWFKGRGVGVRNKTKPVSVLLPAELDSIIRSMENRSEFIREAIAEKLEREGLAGSHN
jgi:hypothetical protein